MDLKEDQIDEEGDGSDSPKYNMRTFRSSREIEGFYRFIYENSLREETYQVLKKVTKAFLPKRKKSKRARKKKSL